MVRIYTMQTKKKETMQKGDKILEHEISRHVAMRNSNYTISERKKESHEKIDKILVLEISRHDTMGNSNYTHT